MIIYVETRPISGPYDFLFKNNKPKPVSTRSEADYVE